MVWLVHRRVASAGIGLQAVLLEAIGGVIVRRLQHHIHAPTQVAKNRTAVALQRRHHLNDARFFQHATLVARPHHMRQIVDATGWKRQAVGGHVQACGVGDRRHFDGRLGAVKKRVEHLRVHSRRLRLIGGQAVMAPDLRRRHIVIGRQIFCSFPGGHDVKTGGAGPVHQLGG